MKKTILSILALVFVITNSFSQSYSFSTYTGAYVNLTNSTSLNNGAIWDDPWFTVPIGFDFQLFDTTINELTFFADALGGELMVQRNIDTFDVITAVSADIIDRAGFSGNSLSNISYTLTGTVGNQILKIEWNNAGFYDDIDINGTSTDYINFQLWLYEGSNTIEVRYGPNSVQPSSMNGNTGFSVGLYNKYNWQDGSTVESIELSGNASTPVANFTQNYQSTILSTVPTNARIYQFSYLVADLDNLDNNFVTIYPNPAEDHIEITSSSAITSIKIYSSTGTLVDVIASPTEKISIDDLDSGIYFLEVTTESGTWCKKFNKL